MKAHSRYKAARAILIFWCLFIGAGALFGAACMLLDPAGTHTGMAGLLPGLRKLPFADTLFETLIFSGIALFCVNGAPNIIAAVLLIKDKRAGAVCGTVFGCTLMAWICIQFVIFPSNPLSNIYFTFGILQALTGLAALIFRAQEHFHVSADDYPNIGTNPKRLVVYFSRMGYTKKAALEEAQRTGAVVYEVRAAERTQGTAGFWWCGRFGMHHWDMPIEAVTVDLAAYEHVTICTPIWVFSVASPMRAFCREASGKIKNADYIIVHFQRSAYPNATLEMDKLLGLTASGVRSICCRRGRIVCSSMSGRA